jgi:putative effector of murein hydrolase LrgA (UPF0299 family)
MIHSFSLYIPDGIRVSGHFAAIVIQMLQIMLYLIASTAILMRTGAVITPMRSATVVIPEELRTKTF